MKSSSLFLLFVLVISIFQPFSLAAQFYVAPNGNDVNSGLSPEHAFATLDAAQSAMRKSKIKTTYICKGTYFPHGHSVVIGGHPMEFGLLLDSLDREETWSYYPADGYNSAILDGRSTGPDTGLSGMVMISNCTGVTWNGIQIQNFIWNGIFIADSYHTTVINNIIHNGTYNKGGTCAGAIFARRAPNTIISNNAVYKMAYCGILAIAITKGGMNNTSITNNAVLNTMIGVEDGKPIKDGGAIYLGDRAHSSTNIIIKNNFICNYGNSTNWSKGLYFDDGASNITAVGNIITGTGQYAIQWHGGYNIIVTGNIIDIGDSDNHFIALYQGAGKYGTPMERNVFTRNIIIAANGNGGRGWWVSNGADSLPFINNNVYYNYVGRAIDNGLMGVKRDKNVIYENPLICGHMYSINPGSPVYKNPVNFPPISAHWGPPGYVIRAEEIRASCPECE